MTIDSRLDMLWVMLCAAQVLLMQGGFCLLESGFARAKNSINVAAKNLADMCVAMLCFWLVGFGLMFGESLSGWVGGSHFLLSGTETEASLYSFFIFQAMFCGTATTIVSGAVAERMSFRSYLAVSVLVSALLYPIAGHWAWGSLLNGETSGWLEQLGFVDFAGSTVVHSVGAWVALAAVLLLGPRTGRFSSKRGPIRGSHLPNAVLGVVVLWFGWLGFNGGSTLALDETVPGILVNTTLAAAGGGVLTLFLSMLRSRHFDVATAINGVISGLVAITACCHVVSPQAAILIGGVAGALCMLGTKLLEHLKIDDVIGAVPAHGFAGVWGTCCVALFGNPELLPMGTDWMGQLQVQVVGVLSVFGFTFTTAAVGLCVLNRISPLRVSRRDEYQGLNVAEHAASTELVDLVGMMSNHSRSGNFNGRVHEEPFTEVGQVAAMYNRVIDRVNREITARTAAESQYREIYQHAVEGIYQTTLDGRFLKANPALIELLGYDSFESLTESIKDVATQCYADPERRATFLKRIMTDEVVSDFRSKFVTKSGETVWVSENARMVRDEEGQPIYFEGLVANISERMTAERLQQEKEQAEAANRAKSQFLAGMSHEMRTPLNGIITMLDLMAETTSRQKVEHYLDIAQQSSRALLVLINDVLDLSKIEAGKLTLEAIPFDLEVTISETIEMLYHRAREKGLHLVSHLNADCPRTLIGDPNRIGQVLINLVTNAIKFTEAGHVKVNVSVNDSTFPPNLRVEVSDTGIGIPEDRRQLIFESFGQADSSTTRKYGGTGLGLSICEHLIQSMSGQIHVESRVDEGSTFWFEIPIIEPDRETETSELQQHRNRSESIKSEPNGLLKNLEVLLVASQNVETESLFQLLDNWGSEVCWTTSVKNLASDIESHPRPWKVLIVEESLLPQVMQLSRLRAIPHRILLDSSETTEEFPHAVSFPVRPSRMLDTLMSAVTLSSDRSEQSTDERPNDIPSKFGDGRKVLVVDDTEVNRIVAGELLRSIGFEPISAAGGPLAIQTLRQQAVFAVLMDCEMPEMDGFETTRRIRQEHRSGNLHTPSDRAIPIIALTAQAIAEDRQRCLDAGMDEYLTKPIVRDKFCTVLWELVCNSDEPETEAAAEPPIVLSELLERCGGEETAARQIVEIFVEELDPLYDSMARALRADDLEELKGLAHRLKGMAGNVAARDLSEIANNIEVDVDRLDGGQLNPESLLIELNDEMIRIHRWVETLSSNSHEPV